MQPFNRSSRHDLLNLALKFIAKSVADIVLLKTMWTQGKYLFTVVESSST